MAIRRDSLTMKLAAALLAFVTVFLGVRALDGGSASLTGQPEVAVREGELPGATTAQRIEGLQAQVREAPSDPDAYAQLGLAYLQQVRETGDPTFYPRAQGTFEQAVRLDPANFTATSGLGSLALARHDFRGALALGERAARINPDVARNYGVIADAQVELGRYGAAARTLQHYVDVKPELSSYARVSYFRELHGDLPGALGAMRLAVSAGGGTAENVSYVQALVGKLHFDSGDYAGAERAYRTALETDPGFPAATAGLARVEAARGEYDAAIRRLRAAGSEAAAARVRDRPRRDRAGRRAPRWPPGATTGWSAPRPASSRQTGSTPTRSWPSSRPITATRRRRWTWRRAPGRPRRASARPTPTRGR